MIFDWSSLGPLFKQYAVVMLVNLNVLTTGIGIAWASPVLVKLSTQGLSPLQSPATEDQGSWIVSVSALSGLGGALVSSTFSNSLGRKYALLAAAAPKLLGWTLMLFATEVWMIYAGRVCIGVSDGMTFTVVPSYASEVASNTIRGSLGTILQIFSSLGVLLMLGVGPFMQYSALHMLGAVLTLACALPLIVLPDTPFFLHSKGRREEAIKVLTFLQSASAAQEEMKEYDSTTKEEKPKLSQLLSSKATRKALIIVTVIGIGAQATGFNAVQFYLQTILISTHTSIAPETASVAIGCIQLFSSLCTTVMTDKFGRKPILCLTLLGIIIGLTGLGIFFKLTELEYPIAGFLQYLPLVSLILVVFSYSAGLGSLMWPLMAELFTGEARATGIALGSFSGGIVMFLFARFFAPLTTLLGAYTTYWMFASFSSLLAVFILVCVPETKGKSFSEIQDSLQGK